MLHLPPLSLYIHIPWCVRKCPYCDFNSHTAEKIPEQAYVEQLLRDLDNDLQWVQGRTLSSIFFGGGTPSLFSAQAIGDILTGVQQRIPFADNIEITLEANPGTAEIEKFFGFRTVGVNRLSIGVQSFAEKHLHALGRIHNGDEARRAVAMAKNAGFKRINIDLMHGLPEQTVDDALQDLQTAIALGVSHLSWYQLTIEPNTVFYRQPPVLPVDDVLWDIQQAGLVLLQQHGFEQYEVSAFARAADGVDARCQHNLNYWHFGDYLGIGAGAHGKITVLGDGTIFRYQKTRLPKHYLQCDFLQIQPERNAIAEQDLPFEFMLNALRLYDGVPTNVFVQRTGLSLETIEKTWQRLQQEGLMVADKCHLSATEKGYLFLNDVLTAFMPD
jgi:oxygen-independent coproporphyrinogen-3 oxidase